MIAAQQEGLKGQLASFLEQERESVANAPTFPDAIYFSFNGVRGILIVWAVKKQERLRKEKERKGLKMFQDECPEMKKLIQE